MLKKKLKYTIQSKILILKNFYAKKDFSKKKQRKPGFLILKFSKTKYTPTDKYYEALNYLNSLKMNIDEKQKLYRKHNSSSDMFDKTFSTDTISFDLHHLKSYVFAFHEFISNFTEISTILGISGIASICKSYADASYQSVMSASKYDACKACKG